MSQALREQVAAFLGALPRTVRDAHIADEEVLWLPGDQPPWQATGLRVRRGQWYSLFARGRIQWSAHRPERHGGPRFHLWARVSPGGTIVNPTQDTGTFTADRDGELELGIYMGLWRDAHGTLATPADLYTRLAGALECWVVVWHGDPRDALTAFAALDRTLPWLAAERARLAAPVPPPKGWTYRLETGTADIFTDARMADGTRCIRLEAHDDQGIVCAPVDCPLTPTTTLTWRWRARALPSDAPEDTPHTHDYFSVATEFDDGRDLTWIWSSSLSPGTYFQCPVRAWQARETHFVVRSGSADPAAWVRERRCVYDDVRAAMAAPAPHRIVRVWLIALCTFQHRRASADFAEIALEHPGGRIELL